MELSVLIQRLNFKCRIHNEQPLNLFCMFDECQSKGLICSICEQQFHDKHKPLSFKYLLNEIYKDYEIFSQGKNLLRLTSIIDEEYLKLMQLLDKKLKKQQRQKIKQSIQQYFIKLRNLILKPNAYEFYRLYESIKQKKIKKQQINNFFFNYRLVQQDQKAEDNTNNSHVSNFQLSIKQLINQLKSKYQQMEKQIKLAQKIQNLLQIYVFAQVQQKINFFFSDTLKHTSHQITNKNLIIQKNNYNTNFALIQPPLETNKKSTKIKTINFKITKLTSWITLGVAHQNIVKTANFYFNTGSVGHGAYVVSHDGYTWHNTVSSLNSFYHNWNFNQGDTVHVTWNPKTKTLKYSKNEETTGYEFQYETIPGDKLHFCISLSGNDETVEII